MPCDQSGRWSKCDPLLARHTAVIHFILLFLLILRQNKLDLSIAVLLLVQVELYWELQSGFFPRLGVQRRSASKRNFRAYAGRHNGVPCDISRRRSPCDGQYVDG